MVTARAALLGRDQVPRLGDGEGADALHAQRRAETREVAAGPGEGGGHTVAAVPVRRSRVVLAQNALRPVV